MNNVPERSLPSLFPYLAALALGSSAVRAEEPQADVAQEGLQEVVVSAQHRLESLQDVPIAVSAFQQEDLERFGFVDPTALATQTPSLEIKGSQGQSKPNVFLRGVGNNDFNATASGAVGFYADQVFQGLPSAQLFQMFDLERVEVLRGPQGTLYGRNTTGGAINFISRQPNGTIEADMGASFGRFDQLDANFGVQFPLSSDLSTRIAGIYRSSNGDITNQFNGSRVRDFTTFALRDLTRWQPTDAQTWTLNIHAARYDGDGPRYHFVPRNNGAYPDDVLPLIGITPPYRETDWFAGSWDLPQSERVDNLGSSLTGEIRGDELSFTSITAYETVDAYVRYDSDASPLDFVNVSYGDRSWMISQELRLTSPQNDGTLSWLTGAYFYRDHITATNTFDIARFARDLFGAVPDPSDPFAPAFYVQHYPQATHSLALFGSATYKLSSAWSATLGLRWTQDHKSIDYHTYQDESDTIGIVPLIDVRRESSWSNVSESASVQYVISPAAMAYASFNRGYKSGAYNGSALFDASAVRAVDPEYVNAFELGTKTQWLNNRVVLNVALFYNDYTDLQVFRFIPDPTTGVPTAALDNAASADIKGLEVELHARPMPRFDLQVGAAFLDSKYKRYVVREADPAQGIPAVEFSGNRLVGAPKTHINVAAEYGLVLPAAWKLTPRAEYAYNSRLYFDASNDPLLSQAAYGLVNGSVRLENPSSSFEISAWVRNATNKKYATDALDLSDFGLDITVHGAPRSYGVSVGYRFE